MSIAKFLRSAASVLLLFTVAAAGCGWWGGSSSDSKADAEQTGSRTAGRSSRGSGAGAPRSMQGVAGPNLFRLPMIDGRPVTVRSPAILFFFTSWCGYCKQVMPEFKALAQRAVNQGWRVYGIDVGETPQKANTVIQEFQPNFPVILDQQSLVAKQYGLEGYPTFIVIDESGNITYNDHTLPRGF